MLSCPLRLFFLTVLALVNTAAAQQKSDEPGEVTPEAAFQAVTDVPGLPRVLLIGDSISIGYTVPLREKLKETANVHRIPENGGPSRRGVEKLDQWLGAGRWDLIHFNFGLHDIRIREGRTAISAEEYERNLRRIVERLEKTGAKLVWCSTTPVPAAKLKRERHDKDVVAFNEIAARIMQEKGIAVDDLYAFALPQLAKIQNPNDVHFSAAGSAVLAGQVGDSITASLKK